MQRRERHQSPTQYATTPTQYVTTVPLSTPLSHSVHHSPTQYATACATLGSYMKEEDMCQYK